MGDVVLDTPIPSDWVRLNFDEYRALVRSPDDGWEASVLAGLLNKPALAAVSLDLRIREGFGFVMACQVVPHEHVLRYAPGYLHGVEERALWIRCFARSGDRLVYHTGVYAVFSGSGMLYSVAVPRETPSEMEASMEDGAVRMIGAYVGLNLLLLRGGASASTHKGRAGAGSVVSSAGRRPLRSKVRVLGIQAPGGIRAAVEDLIERSKPRVRRCASWSVRGHYRHYANGRVIYVHPHVKGPDRLTVAPAGHDYDIKGV